MEEDERGPTREERILPTDNSDDQFRPNNAELVAAEDASVAIGAEGDPVNRLRAVAAAAMILDEKLWSLIGVSAAAVEAAILAGPGCDRMVSCLCGRIAGGTGTVDLTAVHEACAAATDRLRAAEATRSVEIAELSFIQHSASACATVCPLVTAESQSGNAYLILSCVMCRQRGLGGPR